MARARNIWLVVWYDYDGVDIKASFTVKHELQTWLRKSAAITDLNGYGIQRWPDGEAGDVKRFRIDEVLSASI